MGDIVKKILLSTVFAASAFTAFPSAAATIQAIVPFPAGGPLDLVTRVVTAQMQQASGDVFVVDNRGGANGMIGARAAAGGAADGSNLLFTDGAIVTVNPRLYPRNPAFDPERDLKVVAAVAFQPSVLVVNPSVPAKTLKDFIAYAKDKRVDYASGGVGSQGHLTMAAFAAAARLDMTHVPYKGGAPAMNDLVGGQVTAAFVGVAGAMGFIKSGRLKALAVSGDRRAPALPDVPTASEAGLPGFVQQGAYFVMVPAKTPDAVVRDLERRVLAAASDKQVQQKLRDLGLDAKAMGRAASEQWLAADRERMGKLIADNGIKAE